MKAESMADPMRGAVALLAVLAFCGPSAARAEPESQCFGTVSHGRLDRGARLPGEGRNFSAYSALAAAAGRTHVHSKVAGIVVAAYASLADTAPGTRFVYGETGLPSGGQFRPHRTHQNGLSVDFFVPVRNAAGQSVPLPASLGNRLGYDIEFDANARYEGLNIDFPAVGEHLYQLHVAAKAHGAGIALVIFDAAFMTRLFDTPRGPFLRQNLRFMKGKPWVRHDEHYHVDFAIACKPL